MERFLRLKKSREVIWHPRSNLHPHLHPTTYAELHPNLPLKQAIMKLKKRTTNLRHTTGFNSGTPTKT